MIKQAKVSLLIALTVLVLGGYVVYDQRFGQGTANEGWITLNSEMTDMLVPDTTRPETAAVVLSEPAKNGKVNLNTANAAQLEALPGIGPSKVQAILNYRKENGDFQKPEDLKKVKGIGEKTYESLESLITVSQQ